MTVKTWLVRHGAGAGAAAVILLPQAGPAQSLSQRVASAPAGALQFAYAARPGVCGNGRTYYSINGSMWFGSMNDNTLRSDPCQPGPVRVVLGRAGKEIVDVNVSVGRSNFVGAAPAAAETKTAAESATTASRATRRPTRIGPNP